MSRLRCLHCGEQVKLSSFRLPPNKCEHCGQLRNPHEMRENLGCVAFLPIAIAAAVVFGYVGFLLGERLAFIVKVPDFAPRLAFLAGGDGVGIVTVIYWRVIGGPNAKAALAPIVIFFMFAVFGMKCGHGFGIGWLIAWGLINGLLGLAAAIPLLPTTSPSDSSVTHS